MSFRSIEHSPTSATPRLWLAAAALAALLGPASAFAQGAKPGTATPPPAVAPPSAAPAPEEPRTSAAQTPDLVRAAPGGLTADQVAVRAAKTSYSAKASEENIRAAAARVDAAWANYLPRVTTAARYTRLSNYTVAPLAPGFPGFALILDQYLLQASVAVPISDYFLRINEAHTAATHAAVAAKHDVVAARAKSAADGKVAYYGWLTAQAALVVATATHDLQKTLVQDAKNQFAVGNASKADVLQAESAVAAADLMVERAKNLVSLTERQVKVAMHAGDDERFSPGEDFDRDLPQFEGNLNELVREAHTSRYEIKSIDANADAAVAQARAVGGGRYPSLSAFADGVYANPNSRKFPQTDEWFGTWALGAQVTWSPNDLMTSSAGMNEADARAAQLVAQKGLTRDGIELEVTQAFQAVREAEAATATTKRQLEASAEAYRVARELFTHGRATATQVREAETGFTRARLESLNAKAQSRTGRVRLEHALGRSARDLAK
ncbi:MAG: TolC family protein [Myxococcales bacterium]|nr:TolC family protein [Myxococcales bacterium]